MAIYVKYSRENTMSAAVWCALLPFRVSHEKHEHDAGQIIVEESERTAYESLCRENNMFHFCTAYNISSWSRHSTCLWPLFREGEREAESHCSP